MVLIQKNMKNKPEEIIEKIKESGLSGRGGAQYPTGFKWEAVKNAKGEKKYVICNASEGEPDTFKDKYILENFPEQVIEGISLALSAVGANEAYIFLRSGYYDAFKERLEGITGNLPIKLWRNNDGYLEGEETVLINCIEGDIKEPRLKPPYPTECGLYDCPTLINNVETFYAISQIHRGTYESDRFYSLSGDIKKPGVYKLSKNLTAFQVLQETGNLPERESFFQVGGGANGEILLAEELDRPVAGAGVIVVYDRQKTDLRALMEKWVRFFMEENCDRCVPCREGAYRIWEILQEGKLDDEKMDDIFFALDKTSFCPLGKGISLPLRSLRDKVILKNKI